MSSNNNAGIKKMSLEEFLGDDTLGDSVWNEDDINLDAISNTTNIDLLKNKSQKHENYHDAHHPFGHQQHSFGIENDAPSFANKGPPYIVKFSQLPPRFSDGDIHDLFHEKYTKFIKFKLFWELNKNPSISTLKTGSVFEQNFKRTGKAGFVELYSGRDMDKILKYWSAPLLTIHKIKVEPAEFDDFKEYRTKCELLTDPKDDAGRAYIPPKPKSNPFGAAKPVDTQSKILAIEEQVGTLHIEDTKTLRRLSEGDSGPANVLQPGKVTLLKKSPEEHKQEKKKPLSYSEVVKKSAEEIKKQSSSSSAAGTPSPGINRATLASENTENDAAVTLNNFDVDSNHGEDEDGKAFTFKDADRSPDSNTQRNSSPYQRSARGSRGGGGFSRGNNDGGYRRGGGRGGRGGRGGPRYQNRDRNDNETFPPRKFNRQYQDQKTAAGQNVGQGNNNQDEKRYSIFKPASGFLHENGNENSNYKHNSRGGFNNQRGQSNNRGRYNNGFTPA